MDGRTEMPRRVFGIVRRIKVFWYLRRNIIARGEIITAGELSCCAHCERRRIVVANDLMYISLLLLLLLFLMEDNKKYD